MRIRGANIGASSRNLHSLFLVSENKGQPIALAEDQQGRIGRDVHGPCGIHRQSLCCPTGRRARTLLGFEAVVGLTKTPKSE